VRDGLGAVQSVLVFGGTSEAMRVKDTPMADKMPVEARDKIMHASFNSPSISFFASDGRDSKAIDPDAGKITCSGVGNIAAWLDDGEHFLQRKGGKLVKVHALTGRSLPQTA